MSAHNRLAWVSGRGFGLDSVFGHAQTFQKQDRNKKKMFWPKHTKAQETVNDVQGKKVSAIRVKEGPCSNGTNANDILRINCQ